jgi:filamentous hemagglutinin family protein
MNYTPPPRKQTGRLMTPVRLGVVAVAACFLSAPVLSNPVNPTVVNGTATFNQAGNVLTVTNSNGAIINWDKFSIAAGEKTHFEQSSASSSVLNRVLSDPTAIYGTLSSNGRVWLINPAGIMVGAGGRVDTAAFVASTLNIRNEDFLAGRNLFINDGTAKDVINQGEIKTPAGGSVYLIGANVKNESVAGEANSGIITTPGGETILAAGATVSLIDSALPGIKVDITGATGNATNLGTITAEAGRIGIAGVIVKNSGTLNASSVVSEGGRIFLKASQDAYVDGNGRIVTTGSKGGSVEVLGNRVAVMDNASIDASATSEGGDGGTIKVGGDYQGKNPDIQNANITYFGPDASLKADAGKVGAGGTVIVWADDTTRAYGHISVRGGALGGNGGFVEVSGHRYLDFHATVDRRAPNGKAGTLLIDPADITISNAADNYAPYGSFVSGVFSGVDSASGSSLSWATIDSQLALGALTIQTSAGTGGNGDIFITASKTLTGANPLTLLANRHIAFSSGVSVVGNCDVNLIAGWNNTGWAVTPGTGNITFATGSSLSATGDMYISAGLGITLTDSTVSAGGTMDVHAQTLAINAVTMNAGLQSQGNQTVTLGAGAANGSLQLTSTVGEARLSTYGSQVITFSGSAANTLQLQGSNGNTTYGGNAARIEAGGTQNISYGSGSLAISAIAGTGTATYGGSSYHDYGGPGQILVCASCATHNEAQIRSTGNQTISATAITITGGSGGNGNWAGIESKASSNVTASGAITITGGSGGGVSFGLDLDVTNDAGIHADGALTVTGGSIALHGGGAAYGGAYIGGKSSVTVNTTGNLSLYGGSTAAQGAPLTYADPTPTNFKWLAPAIIGSDAGSLVNVTVNVGGNLYLNGGAMGQDGGSPAMIGGANDTPVNVSIVAQGGVTLASGNYLADRIGSNAGGSVEIHSGLGGYGGMNLGLGLIGTGAGTGTVLLDAQGTGSISQAAGGMIFTDSLDASASSGTISLASFENRVDNVDATTANQTITINGQSVGLGTIDSGTGSSTISALYDIHDNNGSSVTNVTAGSASFYSTYGGAAGDLAISVDTETSGNITGSVSASATYGGIYVRNLSGTPSAVMLTDNAANDTQALFYNSGSFATAGSSFTAAYGGDISLLSGGNLTFSGGTFNTGGAGSISLGAVGTLYMTSALAGGANDILLAGSAIDVLGSVSTTGDLILTGSAVNINSSVAAYDVGLVAGSLTVGGSGGIHASNSLVGVVTGDVNITGGYLKTTNADLELLVGGDLNISYGGYIWAGYTKMSPYYPDASILVGGDLKLNNGAHINAANDVYLDLMGSASTLVLNDGTAGYSPSYILSDIGTGIPATTHLAFAGRSSGGVVIDGIETTTTAVGGSGFFAVNTSTPAIAGAGLEIAYSGATLDICVLSPDLCKPPPPTDNPIDEPPPSFDITGPGGTQPGSGTGGTTAGGTEGSFGGDDSGGDGTGGTDDKDDKKDEKDKDKDKKADNGKEEKKDEKSGQKKVAQCS